MSNTEALLSLSQDGYVILAGIYQLFHLKLVWYYFLGGLGALWGYYLDNNKKGVKHTIKGAVFTFISSILTIYLVIGALEYVFDVKQHVYVFFVAGYFSRYINAWIETNAEDIVDKFSSKIFEKIDIDLNNKKDKKDE